MTEITVHRLTPERVADYLAFFDRDAFADNPEWASCYCRFYNFCEADPAWEKCTASENRAAVAGLIRDERMHGFLAYHDGRPVAWCQASLLEAVPALESRLSYRSPEGTGVITCFVVAAPYRRQGVARRLLGAACEALEQQGVSAIEAFPKREAENDAESFPGPLPLYLEAGFVPVRELKHRTVVRRELGTKQASE